jgi:beta-glucanase (GH16 family)
MLGENISSAGWPSCGEIDIMELVGGGSFNNRTIHGTVHWSENGAHASYGDASTLPSGEMYAEQFHVFSIIWNASSIRFLRDDVQYHDINISGSDLSAFQNNFFLILNVAVGGNWPGSPNQNTLFPQTMAVDYVRVFQ